MAVESVGSNAPDGMTFGTGITEKISFYGVTPIAQRASASQDSTVVSVSSADFSTAHSGWALEVTDTLVALGIWKGSA